MCKKVFVSLAVLVLLAVVVVPVAAITWGEPDVDGKYPNVGAMVYDHPDHGLWQTCSGTLIHPSVFLTAGHCTEGWDDPEAGPVWVNFDTDALNEDTLLNVEEVITHPKYDWGDSDPHDVGVLILEDSVTDIEPAELAEEGFLDDLKESKHPRSDDWEKFMMVGYGGTLEEGDWPPPEINYYDLRRYAESEYVALTKVWLHLSQHLSEHSQWDTTDGGTCFGDSGGPAFWTNDKDNEVLVAVTSTGDAQCVATGLYYRVDVPDTLDFIEDVIDGLE